MKGARSDKARDLQKPFPGCMGRMIGVFDLSSGLAGPKLITEKAHRDGSPMYRDRPDVVKAMDPVGIRTEDKPILSGLRSSSKKVGGKPMNLLMAQKICKDSESKQSPSNIVARLMGLDALPIQQSGLSAEISSPEDYSHKTLAGAFRCYRQREDWCNEDPVPREIHSSVHEKECTVVYEIQQKPSKMNRVDNNPLRKGKHDENLTEKRMALVRQKFLEAKCLATDEKFIRSKEFQDALTVLSSNRDLFLKFLDEPNSLFSKHLQEFETARPLSQPRRITLLKPARTVESKDDKQVRNHQHPSAEENESKMNEHHWNSNLIHQKAGSISRSTRIVVLKPSSEKLLEIKGKAACPIPSTTMLEGRDFHGDVGSGEAMGSGEVATNEDMESREIAKESTQQMQESLNTHRRDGAFLSSALSNRKVGDDNSVNISANNCIEEDDINTSDLESASPTSRHSRSHDNKLDAHQRISSLSHPPESSVIREAKKRLSERWTLVASNTISHEQRQEQSSGTLGEMLAIRVVHKEYESEGPTVSSSWSCGGDQDSLSISRTDDYSREKSFTNLSRSNSVPILSSFCEGTGLKEEVPVSLINQSILPKSVKKLKSGKLSFKGKVASLFFSKIKKPVTQKLILGPLVSSDVKSGTGESIEKDGNKSLSSDVDYPGDCTRVKCKDKSGKASFTRNNRTKQQTSFSKAALSLEKPWVARENQDQPSPSSVSEAPFKDDVKNDASQFPENSIVGNPQALCRAPLIESLARSLSWDTSHLQTSLPKTTNQSALLSEEDMFMFVQKLLSSAGLDNKKSKIVLAQWHSLDNPLNPMLLDDFLSRKVEEAKCRAKRSNLKLLFDCVDAALCDIGHSIQMVAYPWSSRTHDTSWKGIPDAPVTEVVWGLVSDWSSGEGDWVSGGVENSNPVVDRMVKRDVTGRRWAQSLWLEIDEFGKEIGGKLLDELVEEALTDLTGTCL